MGRSGGALCGHVFQKRPVFSILLHAIIFYSATISTFAEYIEQNRTEQNALFPIIGLTSRTIRHEDVIEKGANRRLCLVLVRPSEK